MTTRPTKDLGDLARAGTLPADPITQTVRVERSKLRLVEDASGEQVEAERAICAALLWGATYEIGIATAKALADVIDPSMMLDPRHAAILAAATSLEEQGKTADVVTLHAETTRRGTAVAMEYLDQVVAAAIRASTATLRQWALIVHDLWRIRVAAQIAKSFAVRADAGPADVQVFVDEATHSFAELGRLNPLGKRESNMDAMKRIVREISARDDLRGAVGIRTGIKAYDQLTRGGLHASQKTTVAALPGRGKTTFALQIATHIAGQGIGVLFFSQEMTRDELLVKCIANIGSVDSGHLKTKELADYEWPRLHAASSAISKLPLWIDDTPDLHVGQIRARALAQADRVQVDGAPLGLIVVDYVQRLKAAPEVARADRHHQVAHATRALKLLAQELKIPVLELAQQKPSVPEKGTKVLPRPSTGCVADSSAIEKEADNLAYLHRMPRHDSTGRVVGEDRTKIELILDKQRGGEPGTVLLRFFGEFARFAQSEEQRDP